MSHASAQFTPAGRLKLVRLVLDNEWAQARAAEWFQCTRSTVSKWLARYRMPLLGQLDRIPDGGGHRTRGRQASRKNSTGVGYSYLHSAIDDHSRLVYSEIDTAERKETPSAFWRRARRHYRGQGTMVRRVMTDNGSCYRSFLFAATLGVRVNHKFTRPYRPQTNGKIERFHRTLAAEWAYAEHDHSDAARAATYQGWVHHYNHHGPPTGIGAKSPIERVYNVRGKNT